MPCFRDRVICNLDFQENVLKSEGTSKVMGNLLFVLQGIFILVLLFFRFCFLRTCQFFTFFMIILNLQHYFYLS